jgi:uncharacterized damage-inducible protein DinB
MEGVEMHWRQLLTDEIEYGYGVADKVMAMVDGDKLDWKPETGSNWMTTGQLLKHIASSTGPSFVGIITGDWKMPDGVDMAEMKPEDMLPPAEALPSADSVEAARKELADDKKLTLEMLSKVSDEDLDVKPAPVPWDPRPVIMGHRLLSMVLHIMQHKGQLFYYLKLQGKPVNTNDLWGM